MTHPGWNGATIAAEGNGSSWKAAAGPHLPGGIRLRRERSGFDYLIVGAGFAGPWIVRGKALHNFAQTKCRCGSDKSGDQHNRPELRRRGAPLARTQSDD